MAFKLSSSHHQLFVVAKDNDIKELDTILENKSGPLYNCLISDCMDIVLAIAVEHHSSDVAVRLLSLVPRALRGLVLQEISDAMEAANFHANVRYIHELAQTHHMEMGNRIVPEYLSEDSWKHIHQLEEQKDSREDSEEKQ